jgi:hypothetical protein
MPENSVTWSQSQSQERFFKEEEKNIFVLKTHLATRGVVNFYSAGVVTCDRRIGSRLG